ncbi:MAG: response regulator [Abditibacteriota bacterium]|nr:response regulator [Abditibacteriota bacterium]
MAKKILIVDDDENILALIEKTLEKAKYEVVKATDGKQALNLVVSERPDLLILDIMMPYLDGFEVLQTLRRYPATRNIPVIILTAKDNDDDVFVGWQAGVSCYMIKPFNPTETLSQIKRIFEAKRTDTGEGAERRYNL